MTGIDISARRQEAIDEFLALLRHERDGDGWIGRTPDWYGPVVFGGIGLAVTISAACLDAPEGGRLHSLHGHFLRPVQGGSEIRFETTSGCCRTCRASSTPAAAAPCAV